MKIKYHAKFLNKTEEYPEGTPFEMPNWTPRKHEAALAKLSKYTKEKGIDEEESNKEFKYFVVYETFLEIDPNCNIENVRDIHPVTLSEWFNAIYNAGRESIVFVDFPKGRKTQKLKGAKSTGKKN